MSPPGGGGTDRLEQRVVRLEVDIHEVRAGIKGLRDDRVGLWTDMAELKGRVAMLPGYQGLIIVLGAFLTVIGAVGGVGGFLIGSP